MSPPAEFVIAVAKSPEVAGVKSVGTGTTPIIDSSAGYGRIIRNGVDNDIAIPGPVCESRSEKLSSRTLNTVWPPFEVTSEID